jgi:RNA polymerase sigma factor for flagellar operon FliA
VARLVEDDGSSHRNGEDGDLESLTDPDQQSPLEDMYRRELLARIDTLLSRVERRMVKLHYFEGLKICEVAKKMRLSPARICQIHGRILEKLKSHLLRQHAPLLSG